MSTMNISLPDSLKSFVEAQCSARGYGTSSEYVRELIRKERDRERLRGLLLEGAASPPTAPADAAFFDELRRRAHTPRESQWSATPREHRDGRSRKRLRTAKHGTQPKSPSP